MIDWFNNIKNKNKARFTQFDLTDFYPSIIRSPLDKDIEFAKSHVDVDSIDLDFISQAKKTLLFSKDSAYVKRKSDSTDICDLAGVFVYNTLRCKYPAHDVGLS